MLYPLSYGGNLNYFDALLQDSALRERYAAAGAKRIHETFTWSKAAKQMSELYQRIISGTLT